VQAGKPGDQIPVTILRNGAEQQVTVTLGEPS
jgi:S1-C subfamily serine protease